MVAVFKVAICFLDSLPVLSLFQIVTFPVRNVCCDWWYLCDNKPQMLQNDACVVGGSNRNGTCYSAEECASRGWFGHMSVRFHCVNLL